MYKAMNLQLILKNAQDTANRDGYDYVVYQTENGYAFARKAEYERDWQTKRKVIEINPE